MSLSSPDACKHFAAVEDPARIAKQLRQDQQSCRDGKLPTVLAHFVPDTGSAKADAVTAHLIPQTEVRIPQLVRRMQYAGIVDGIKAYLAQMRHLDDNERDPINPIKNGSMDMPDSLTVDDEGVLPRKETLDASEIDRMIKTLNDLRTDGILKETDVLPNILDTLRSLAAPGRLYIMRTLFETIHLLQEYLTSFQYNLKFYTNAEFTHYSINFLLLINISFLNHFISNTSPSTQILC